MPTMSTARASVRASRAAALGAANGLATAAAAKPAMVKMVEKRILDGIGRGLWYLRIRLVNVEAYGRWTLADGNFG